MIALHDVEVMLALSDYRAAVVDTTSAQRYGRHGDGRVEAAAQREIRAHRRVLALTAPELLESLVADEVIQAAHREAGVGGSGVGAVDRLYSMVQQAVKR